MSIILSSLTENHIHTVVDIHSKAFTGYMSTKLGHTYLTRFYRWFAVQKDAISIVATDGFQMAGFVVGAPLGYEVAMSRDLFWIACASIFTRPWLLVGKRIRTTIVCRAKTILGKQVQQKEFPKLPEPTVSLVGIGIYPQAQGLGVGKTLIQAFERKAIEMHMKSMRLSVYPENQIARKLYEGTGWQSFSESVLPDQAMYYSKILV